MRAKCVPLTILCGSALPHKHLSVQHGGSLQSIPSDQPQKPCASPDWAALLSSFLLAPGSFFSPPAFEVLVQLQGGGFQLPPGADDVRQVVIRSLQSATRTSRRHEKEEKKLGEGRPRSDRASPPLAGKRRQK